MTTPQPADLLAHPKMAPTPQKRLLALDGGGIRGMLSLEILARVEDILRERAGGGRAEFRLADYFDYIAGTSTGAIIATCLSLGMSVAEVRRFYEENGVAMFDKAGLFRRLKYKFEDEKLAAKLREVFDRHLPPGEPTDAHPHMTLGSAALKTLLLLVMRNATTDSPWPLSNNPRAKYNARDRTDCNLDLPLWQLVRASTAAPTFFPPEEVIVGDHRFLFVDGGVTTYNDPAFLLFLMATTSSYCVRFPVGADRLLLVSVGTGAAAGEDQDLAASDMNLIYNAGHIPGALMFAAMNQQDTLCRVFGECRAGDEIDREIRTLRDEHAEGALLPKLFTYMRYTADLSRAGLNELGLREVDPAHVQRMDSVKYIPELQDVGRAVAAQRVDPAHFDGFI